MSKTILVAGHNLFFINEMINYCKGEFNILIDKWWSHDGHNKEKSLELLNKSDIIFCEWCLGNIVFYSEHKKNNQKLFVRIHRFESYELYWDKMLLDKIDKILFVSKSWMYMHTKIKNINDINIIKKFNLLENCLSNEFKPKNIKIIKKLSNRKKILNLGIIGINPAKRKCPLKCLPVLKELSNRYKINFYIIGAMPQQVSWIRNQPYEIYYNEYKKDIDIFLEELKIIKNLTLIRTGIIPNKIMPKILNKLDYLLVPTSNEAMPQSSLESLMSGCVPLFYGEYVTKIEARRNWPEMFCFNNYNEVINFIDKTFNNGDIKYVKKIIEIIKKYWNTHKTETVYLKFKKFIQ